MDKENLKLKERLNLSNLYDPNLLDISNNLFSKSIPNDYTFNSEIKEQKLVRKLLKTGMIVFDIGAHLGKYTKLFSLLAGKNGKVFAFEPTPESYNKLKADIYSFSLDNVSLFNKAMYSENATLKFYQFPEKYSSWNGLGKPRMPDPENDKQIVAHIKSIEVEAISLDAFCKQMGIDKIDYVKLDVEGAEIFALLGMKNLLQNQSIKYIQFEISRKMLEGLNTHASDVFELLNKYGYECREILEDGSMGKIVFDSDSFYENYIAIPQVSRISTMNKYATDKNEFTEKGLWTPQTAMLRSIKDTMHHIEGQPHNALSIDVNPELEKILLEKWPILKITTVKWPVYDAQNLYKFKDETFDVVFSHQVLEHIPKPWLAAGEIVRVMKKGGVGIHTTCAYNPRHGYPGFKDYYRFLPDGLSELFEGVNIWVKDSWGSKQALIYNLTIDDGFGNLGGRRFAEALAKHDDKNHPWLTWIIFQKK